MSYCLNPNCSQPKNPDKVEVCQACGSKLFLRDRYSVIKMIGQGGFGATFLAHDLSLPGHPCCVIKQLRPSGMVPNMFEMAKELFEREATTLGRIGNHPQVPRLLDFFDDQQQFYLVQEFVSGHNLQQEVKQNGPFSEAGVRQFLSEIMPMLEYIHSQQVIHRDIKPANLIRREQDKKLVLIDFGAVKNRVNLNEAANTSDQTALTQFAVGTPGFAPPEQMAMRPVYASDIYAVGVTCIYLLTAKSPKDLDYNPSTGEMVWQKYVNVSEHFGNVLRKMMEVAVRDRYQNSQEVLRALDLEPYVVELQQGLATPPPPSTAPPLGGTLFSADNSSGMNSSPSSPSSATEKMAMAIKARKARQAMREQSGGNSAFSGNSMSRANRRRSGNTTNIQGKQKKNNKTPKLNADDVLLAYRRGRKDFAGKNLSFINLQGANLSGGLFRETKLTKTNLEGANLTRADFSKASLTQAKLQKANLGRAYFDCANLAGADLRGADLSYAHLSNANLKGTNLCGANLSNARISDDQLAQAKTNWSTTMPNGKRGFW